MKLGKGKHDSWSDTGEKNRVFKADDDSRNLREVNLMV